MRSRDHHSPDTWLHSLHLQLRPWFKQHSYKLPPHFQFRVGWPKSKTALAEIHLNGNQVDRRPLKKLAVSIHEPQRDADHPYTVFVVPTIDNPIEVAASVVHELIHSVIPNIKGHTKPFQDICRHLGLVMTHKNGHTEIDTDEHRWHNHPRRGAGAQESEAPLGSPAGRKLLTLLTDITTDLGPYPHKALPGRPPSASGGTRSNKAIKFRCPECKKFVVRIGPSALWIDDEYCAPLCGNPSCDNYGGECEER